MDLDLIKNEFDKYVKSFDMDNYDIAYKYRHSYRVYKLSEKIAKELELNEEDIVLASVIGLLHDIGRFEQLRKYSSYDDVNLDHAEFGAKLLFEHGLIDKFNINRKYYEVMKFAIRNHNKYAIEETSDKRKIMFAEIIRDADKIDIIKAHAVYSDYKLKECLDNVTEIVSKTFFSNKQVVNKDMVNDNDIVLSNLSMLFDIYTDVAIEIIKKEKLVEEFYDVLKNKLIFKPYFDYMGKFLEER